MTNTNKVILIGRLTRDVGTDERSFGYTSSGVCRMNISLAVNRSKKTGDGYTDEVHYFDVTVWGRQAESLKPYMTKGKQVCVEAHLQQDRWEKDGQKQSRVTIHADNVELLGGKSEGAQQSAPQQDDGLEGNRGRDAVAGIDDGGDFPEDIPF